MSASRVLVLGVIESLTWAVTRCLSRAGIKPTVLGWHRFSPLTLTLDCTYVPIPEPCWLDGQLNPAIIDRVEETCRERQLTTVIPADLDSTLLLARYASKLETARPCAIPELTTLQRCNDKAQFCQLLQRLQLPHPATWHVESAPELLELTLRKLPFPLITKPTIGWAGLGFQLHASAHELARSVHDGKLAASFPLLVQRFVPGRDVGFGFLARHGNLIAYTAFEQLGKGQRRHFDDPRLRRHVAALVEATNYHGVGEVDSRYDPSSDAYQLLELNPRFWASLLYGLKAGINFPALLLQLEDLGEGPGCTTRGDRITLPPYDFAIKQTTQLSERLHDLGARLLARAAS